MIIKKANTHKQTSLISLSRDTDKAIANSLKFLTARCKKPLIVAFGTVEPFRSSAFDVALIKDLSTFGDDILSIQTAVTKGKYDGVMVDSSSLLLRLLRADVAGDTAPSLQEYGQINNRFINAVLLLRALTDVFVTTAAFVLDDDKSKKASKKANRDIEVWELDFTANLRASVFPMFGKVNYIASDDTLVEDRDLAIAGRTPVVEKKVVAKKTPKATAKKSTPATDKAVVAPKTTAKKSPKVRL